MKGLLMAVQAISVLNMPELKVQIFFVCASAVGLGAAVVDAAAP